MTPRPEGGFALDPAFDEGLARLGGRVAQNAIASLTLRESGDRLRALDQVAVRYQADGSAIISNAGAAAISGLTVAIPAQVETALDGARLRGTRVELGRTTIWFDLPAGGQVVVTARALASPAEAIGGERGNRTVRLGMASAPAMSGAIP